MIQNIQGLRFYAALAVLLFHVSSIYQHHNGEIFAAWASAFNPIGRIGVDVFFVISGFVIWTSTSSRHAPKDAAPFALRRIARVFLTYWPALAFAGLVDVFVRGRYLLDYDLLRSITLLPLRLALLENCCCPSAGH